MSGSLKARIGAPDPSGLIGNWDDDVRVFGMDHRSIRSVMMDGRTVDVQEAEGGRDG